MKTAFPLLILLISVSAHAQYSAVILKEYCDKNVSDHWIKTSDACALARGETDLSKLCEQFGTSNNPRTRNRMQSIIDKYAELSSIDSDAAAEQLCPKELGSQAIKSKPECLAEASGKSPIQRSWWDGQQQTKTSLSFPEVKSKADTGDEVAQFNIGVWLASGTACIPKDMKLGVQYLCKSYDKGYGFAGMRLKSMTSLPSEQLARESLGKQHGCPLTARQEEYAAETRRLEIIAKEQIKRAEAGDVGAMIKVATLYQASDDGLTQDFKKAFYWAEKAATKGNVEGMSLLGSLYNRGDGVEQDHEKAFHWNLKAAQGGDVDSMYFIGLNYYDGQGVERNLTKSVQWLVKAMDNGSSEAQEKLVEMFVTGELQAVTFKSLSDRLKKLESKK